MIHVLWRALYWTVLLSGLFVAYALFVVGENPRIDRHATRVELQWHDAKLVIEEGE
jgi:hypothetical protein